MTPDAMFGALVITAIGAAIGMALVCRLRQSRRWAGVKRDRRNYWEGK